MFSLLLAIIYLSFISLGLPDSLLGSAWPVMVGDFGVPLSYAGIVSMIISAGTIVSSLLSDKLTRRLGTGMVTAGSVMMTAAALVGFSLTDSFGLLCLIAIPYGLGAGAVDAALNNYVALHYASRHMNWLHCFWGVGVTVGPYIMGWAIGAERGWRTGYRIVSVIQLVLTVILFFSLPLWKKKNTENASAADHKAPISLRRAVGISGVKPVLLAFFCYCAFESTTGLWASSYLVKYKNVDIQVAATFASLFYLGITIGRFISGFIADKLGDKNMIRIGIGVMLTGNLLIALPVSTAVCALIGLTVIGLGAAPVYPSVIHATPRHFGAENSQAIVAVQMASAYCGSTLIPPVFGLVAQYIHIACYPFFIAVFVILLLLMTERVNQICNKRKI